MKCCHRYCDDVHCHSCACYFHEASKYVVEWLKAQPNVGEESITDWLLYDLSKNVPSLTYKKFTRHDEAKRTGADWEWWFIDKDKAALSLRVQAKKLLSGKNSGKNNYKNLAHKNKHGLQIEKLLEDSKRSNSLPFYSLYYAPSGSQEVLCKEAPNSQEEHGVFLADADNIYNILFNKKTTKVEATKLVEHSNPLCCIAGCCIRHLRIPHTVSDVYSYLERNYYGGSIVKSGVGDKKSVLHKKAPDYVLDLLQSKSAERPDERENEWENKYRSQIEGLNAIFLIDLTK